MKNNLRYNFIYSIYCLYELRYGKILLNNYGYSPSSIKRDNANQLQFYVELLKAGGITQSKPLNVCEIGCGQGHGSLYLLTEHLHKDSRLTGLDASQVAVQYCKWKHRKFKKATFKTNSENMPFANETLDLVLSVETGVPHHSDQLREIYRSLNPSGLFIWLYMAFGVFLTKTDSNEYSKLFPRFLTLWTNSKKLSRNSFMINLKSIA